jgi:starch synthase
MVAAEGLPFIKTGGLADVVGSLPISLTELGHEVKVVLPLYRKLLKNISTIRICISSANTLFLLTTEKFR